jgi:CRISPR-associated protein Csh1
VSGLLNALYEIGKLWIEKEQLDKIEVLLDASKLKKRTKSVLVVELKESGEGFTYSNVIERDYDPLDNVKYLYRTGSSRGTDITPSCLITELDKTLTNKFFKWFENNNNETFFKQINETLSNNKEEIVKDIGEKYENITDKTNVLLTLGIITSSGDLKYIGDYELFKNVLIDSASSKYYKKGSKEIKGDGVCFLCDEEKEVCGLVSNSIGFSFSTPDKPGNVPGLNIAEQWKQLPICSDCALYLEAGKKFVEKYLTFQEFGLNYYVIPSFLINPEKGFNTIYKYVTREETNLKYKDNLVAQEDRLASIISDLDDILEFKFLFFQKSNSAFDILAYVESVLPSWMREIYDNQIYFKRLNFFNEENMKLIFGKNVEGDFIEYVNSRSDKFKVTECNWYLSFLRDFFSNYSTTYYLDMVTSIMSQKKIDYNFLLTFFMKKISENLKQGYNMSLPVLKSFILILLFNNLNLFKGGKLMELNMEDNEKLSLDSSLLDDFLNTPDKKAVFLLGDLTRKLTYKQYKELGASPFMNKLWGLSLDKNKIIKLYPMVFNKLREYGTAYPNLEENISTNLLYAENNWKLTRDEISYYFVLGYTLAYAINDKKTKEIEDGDE